MDLGPGKGGGRWEGGITKEHKEVLRVMGLSIFCIVVIVSWCACLSKCVKLCTSNMYSLLYVNYSKVDLSSH